MDKPIFTSESLRIPQQTPWGEPLQQWQVERHYMPSLLELDKIISNLERLIWELEHPKHPSVSDNDKERGTTHVVTRVICSSDYQHPLAQIRNKLLEGRNQLAAICGVKVRRVHDLSPDALGYLVDYRTHLLRPVAIQVERYVITEVEKTEESRVAKEKKGGEAQKESVVPEST